MKARKKRAEIARDDLWKWICGIAAVFALIGLFMAYIPTASMACWRAFRLAAARTGRSAHILKCILVAAIT